ncbi:MAG: chitobiase/beta-hexosaminidase C-terminal domain-containing protein [bacterium]
MKNMSFKILTSVLFGLLFSLSLPIGYVTNAYSQQAYVIEDISYDPVTQIYTYTYTLKNLGKKKVWWWGIWYSEDPKAILDDSTIDANGFAPTDLTDCSTGWKSTAPPRRMGYYLYNGPNGEPGFYSTYTSDFQSANEPITPDALNLTKIGGQWGWNGEGANILTAYGVQNGDDGYYVIRSKKYFPENKKFFYNTNDYWNSSFDAKTGQLVIKGFEFVSTTQRSYSIRTSLAQGYNLISQPVAELLTPDLSIISYQASSLLSTIPGCQKIIGFDPLSQTTESYLFWNGTPYGDDFPIIPGEAYYAEVSEATSFNFDGLIAQAPSTLNLSQGYNFVSFIYGPKMPDDARTGYTSATLLTALPGCKSVIRFNSLSQKTESYRSWAGYALGTEFDIRVGEGYMVEVLNDVTWTPEKLSLSTVRSRLGDEYPSYSLTSSNLSTPVISDIRESYQTAGSVTISWLTDIDCQGEVHYSTDMGLADYAVVKDSRTGKIHRVELNGLQPGRLCYYEVQSGATRDDNNGYFYRYTPLQPSSPLDNLFIGGRVLRADESPVSGGLVFITTSHDGVNSYPLSTVTDKNGIWVLNLADLKDSVGGDSLQKSLNDPISIEVNGGGGWQSEEMIISDLTEEEGYILILNASALPPVTPLVVATPVLSPAFEAFRISIRVTITCNTEGAVIRYTTNGNDPTEQSTAYTGPLVVTTDTTVKAKGFKSGYTPSDTASGTYSKVKESVATPIISPVSGAFADSIRVEISCSTQGATIHYTKDGSEPTANSLVYTTPLILNRTTTIKAKGFKNGYSPSDTASETFTRMGKVDTPVLSPISYTFSDTINVSIRCATQGTVIHYTMDGSEPTENSPVYTAPLMVAKSTTIKAKAYKNGFTPSDTTNGTYTAKVSTPTLSPAPRTFSDPIAVTISCASPDAVICYTTDGSEPTENSPVYAASLTLTETATVKAKGFKSGFTPSETASGTYTRIKAKVSTPILFPAPGPFAHSIIVSISCNTQGADIHYTMDGSEPTTTSPIYTAPLSLTDKTTIKAKGFKSDWDPSDTTSGTYTKIMEKVATPVLSPSSGTFANSMTVTISCATKGADIRYTTDGSEPDEQSSAYTSPLIMTKTSTLKVKGFKSGFTPSDTTRGKYIKEASRQPISTTNPLPWTVPSLPSYQPWSNSSTPTWQTYQSSSSWSSFDWTGYQSAANPYLGNYQIFTSGF